MVNKIGHSNFPEPGPNFVTNSVWHDLTGGRRAPMPSTGARTRGPTAPEVLV